MKELMGGLWIAGLITGASGLYLYAIIMGILGLLAGAASWYDELLKEKQAADWKRTYPSYKY